MKSKSPLRHWLFLSLILLFSWRMEGQKIPLETIEVSWELVSNLDPKGPHARFTFFNPTEATFSYSDWTLYFNQANVMPKANSNKQAIVTHINGDWFKLTPVQGLFSLQPGDSIVVDYHYQDAMIKASDAPMGLYYVINEGEASQQIAEPRKFRVIPFRRAEQIHRGEKDYAPIPAPERIYMGNQIITDLPPEQTDRIIPTPRSISFGPDYYQTGTSLRISSVPGLAQEAGYLENRLSSRFEAIIWTEPGEEADIVLGLETSGDTDESPESYSLKIDEEGVRITSPTSAGIFYGIQSLLALSEGTNRDTTASGIRLQHVVIEDAPRFDYRGLQLDVGRNFQSKSTIKKVIDILATYKINTFLFYLTEDEGWRLEIEGLPELTEIGARREHINSAAPGLHPAYGSGPVAYREGSFGSGYYSKEDFIEILRYANERHVRVIPEVNLPGHARAAIQAMEKRYLKFAEQGNTEEAERYRLIDPDDLSVYSSAQSYNDNVACVCRESVYSFFEKVVDVIMDYYAEAGVPMEYFHIGGDEVPTGPWTRSPLCADFLAQNENYETQNLHAYYFKKAIEILKKRNLKTAGWEETALIEVDGQQGVNPEFSGGHVIPYVWNTLWGAQDLGYRLANRGYPIVLCPVTNFYFDLAYNKDPEEPGLYWAGFVNTRNAYEYQPFDAFRSTVRNDSYYTPIDQEEFFSEMERLTPEGRNNILGLQAQLWSETIKGPKMMEYYLLPKLLGFAETAWAPERPWESIDDPEKRSKELDKGWNRFVNTVGKHEFARLNNLFGGFNYRIPPPGARILNGLLHANTTYPGLQIRYTLDGSEPGPESNLYENPVPVDNKTVKLRAFNLEGRGSRTSTPYQIKQKGKP